MKPSRWLILVVLLPLAQAKPSHSGSSTQPSTRGLLGGASSLVKDAFSYGANFAQSATVAGTGLAQQVARGVAVGAKDASVAAIGAAKVGTETAIDAAKEGAEEVAHVAKVGAKEALVVASDPTQPIFPGTRWCGAGDKAKNNSDVGVFENVDRCCRSHDKCFDNIPAGEEKYGLTNNGTFTRSHCDCDEEFYRCLKEADNLVAAKVGFTYFNVLRPQCFREERPVVRCAKSSGVAVTKRCEKYEFNERSDKRMWQWFDAKEF